MASTEVWIITEVSGEVYGVYDNPWTANYAFDYAPGSCLYPQKKDVLQTRSPE